MLQLLSSCICALLAYNAGFHSLEIAGIVLSIFFIVKFVNDLGQNIWQVLDVMIVNALLTWILVPLAAFHYFNNQNYLAVLWDKTMKVDAITYYSFVLPGVIALIIGLKWPFIKNANIKVNIAQLRRSGNLNRPAKLGYQLITIGLLSTLLKPFIGESFGFVLYLFNKLYLIGILYLYFSGYRPKNYILIIGLLIMMMTSLQSGMFGELVYMSILSLIIVLQGYRIRMAVKMAVIALGIVSIVLIQSIKKEYRSASGNNGAETGYFIDLLTSRIVSPSSNISENALFGLTVRANQGWLIAATMDKIPRTIPYFNGDPIWQSILGSIVPRVLWSDKPTVGGAANLKRYLNWNLNGTSMNVSPIGEAWANFGWGGGIFFMFCYGLFFRLFFNKILSLMRDIPTLIIWIPLLFFYVVVTETDTLTSLNHLLKSSFFVFLMYKLYPAIFKIKL